MRRTVATRFMLPVAVTTCAFSIVVLYRTYETSRASVTRLIDQQTVMAMEYNLAIRDYVARHIRPVLEGMLGRDEFIPEAMSTSFISRSVAQEVQKRFPNYIVRFAAPNPRNPSNQATPEELEVIDRFNRDPELQEWSGQLTLGGQAYLARYVPKRMEPACLRCHGDPANAPRALLDRYGSKAGFNLPLGRIVALDTVAIPMQTIHASLRTEAAWHFGVILAGVLCVGLVVGVTFKVRVARRLASIAGHLQRTADRPASARIAPIRVLGDDEIGVLARSFNVLAERLNAAHEEMDARVHERTAQLASANDALQRENVQRKLAEEKLRESADLMRAQNEELEAQKQQMIAQQEELKAVNHELEAANAAVQAASRAKSEFLANMSHEIRTPMTAITGYTDLLLDSFCGAHECSGHACSRREECPVQSEAGQHLVTIRRNSDHLLQIIDDILDLSKVEAGKLSVESVECSPVALMEETRSLLQVRADAKKLALRVEADGPVPDRILSDPRRIKQILLNLVGNALKFTGSGGVDVRCRFRAGPEPRLIFEIRDTGIGLSGEQISRLFQPFTQVDASASRQFGGSGLGLAISRRLSEILGGGITVESEPGKGSTFRASIAAPLPEGAALVEPCPAGPDARAISAGPPRLNCRILLAEDGPDNQKLISHVLRRAGAEVTISDNGESAVFAAMEAAMKGEPFDIILMDMQMPVLDGYGATATLRRKGYQRPIIALTAHAMAGDRHKCLDAGCDDYATKPIDRQALFTTITRYLPVAARPSARAV